MPSRATLSGKARPMGSSLSIRGANARTPAGSASDRHNVDRCPELDYFVRKLYPDQAWWTSSIPFSKAGDARPLDNEFSSDEAYLNQMQAHTALEFQAAVEESIRDADGPGRDSPERRWYTFQAQKGSSGAVWVSSGGLDFEDDPWSKHIVEVQETRSFHVVRSAKRTEECNDIMVLLPTVTHQGPCRVRSLGFMGSHLLQYDSAQELKYSLRKGLFPKRVRHLLDTVVCPSHWHRSSSSGTLVPSSPSAPVRLREDVVPVNARQRQAVVGLQGGLNMIHGPPGTGKSTTIFHIIDARVQRGKQALVTCTRNQAVDAVVDKISRVEGSILVFGHDKRLGERAKRFTLKARVEADPRVRPWLEHVERLQSLRKLKGKAASAKVLKAVDAVLSQLQTAGGSSGHIASVTKLRSRLQQGYVPPHRLGEDIVGPLVGIILGRILRQAKATVTQEVLRSTHLFVCTIDSTPRLLYSLAEQEAQLELDTVVVDEAGCVLEMAVPMLLRLHPSNLVLVGDHLQLQAYTDLKAPPANHCRSLMERAVGQGIPASMLTTQYRMAPAICQVVSKVFYGSWLVTAPETAVQRPLTKPCRLVHVNGKETHHPMAGYSNREEAERAVQQALLAAFKLKQKAGLSRPSIFIISLYNRQRDLIEELLASTKEGRQLSKISTCQVLSVDACQGSEADGVVLSTVRNLAGPSPGLSRFFHDRRRSTVALSRAKYLSVIVGSAVTLRRHDKQSDGAWKSIVKQYEAK